MEFVETLGSNLHSIVYSFSLYISGTVIYFLFVFHLYHIPFTKLMTFSSSLGKENLCQKRCVDRRTFFPVLRCPRFGLVTSQALPSSSDPTSYLLWSSRSSSVAFLLFLRYPSALLLPLPGIGTYRHGSRLFLWHCVAFAAQMMVLKNENLRFT